jgi:hypothetical protein
MAHMSGAMIMLNMRAQASLAARPADFEIAVMIMRQMVSSSTAFLGTTVQLTML